MDGPRLWTAAFTHLFSTIYWNWWWHLAFCIYYSNVRSTLANANAAREPYARIVQ